MTDRNADRQRAGTTEHLDRWRCPAPPIFAGPRPCSPGALPLRGPFADAPAPRQLPGDVRGFENRVDELRSLDRLLTDGHAGLLVVI